MDITPLISSDRKVIQSYSGGRFRISSTIYESPVAVFPDQVQPWKIADVASLRADDFSFLNAAELDVVLLGAGSAVNDPLFSLRRDLKSRGLNLEIMDTGAACRTYNVLLSEGRRVVALLLPA